MLELSTKYNEVFKPANAATEQTYLEGIENCVTKNLYSVLFGENGVGTVPEQKGVTQSVETSSSGVPSEERISPTHIEEAKLNQKIRENIQRFGNFVEPRHLELREERLV